MQMSRTDAQPRIAPYFWWRTFGEVYDSTAALGDAPTQTNAKGRESRIISMNNTVAPRINGQYAPVPRKACSISDLAWILTFSVFVDQSLKAISPCARLILSLAFYAMGTATLPDLTGAAIQVSMIGATLQLHSPPRPNST